MPLRIGLLGCSAIGSYVGQAAERLHGRYAVALAVGRSSRPPEVCRRRGWMYTTDAGRLCDGSLDVVVEAASPAAVRAYAEAILRAGTGLVLLSTGALLDPDLRDRLHQAARESGAALLVPSGSLGGLDLLRAAAAAGVHEVTLSIFRAEAAWRRAGLRADGPPPATPGAVVIREGTPGELCAAYPGGFNVAAAVQLTVETPVRVRVLADPTVDLGLTRFRLQAVGAFGRLDVTVETRRIPGQRSAILPALSALSALRQAAESSVGRTAGSPGIRPRSEREWPT